jgi:hypothetical protein
MHPRLAAFICGYSVVTIVISGNYSLNHFREDLQKMYRRAGVKGEGLLFLLTDSQVGWQTQGLLLRGRLRAASMCRRVSLRANAEFAFKDTRYLDGRPS